MAATTPKSNWLRSEASKLPGGVPTLPEDSISLLEQAELAEAGGAYDAAAMACRAAVEAAGWQALYLQRTGPGVWQESGVPRHPNGERLKLDLRRIIEGLRHHSILTAPTAGITGTIKDRGDTVLHIVEKSSREWERAKTKVLAKVLKTGKMQKLPPRLARVSRPEARRLIQDTAEVLLEIYRRAPDRSGPSPYLQYPEPTSAE